MRRSANAQRFGDHIRRSRQLLRLHFGTVNCRRIDRVDPQHRGIEFINGDAPGIRLRLKGTDLKNKRYTIDVTTDDIVVEKKDKAINEPVQFKLSKSPALFELVVNELAKDRVTGYLSSPKVLAERK